MIHLKKHHSRDNAPDKPFFRVPDQKSHLCHDDVNPAVEGS